MSISEELIMTQIPLTGTKLLKPDIGIKHCNNIHEL